MMLPSTLWTGACSHLCFLFGDVPRSGATGTARSGRGNSSFNFLKSRQMVFRSGCTIHLPTSHAQGGGSHSCPPVSFPAIFPFTRSVADSIPPTSYFLRGLQVFLKSGFYVLTFIHSLNYPPSLAQNMETHKLPPWKKQRPWCHDAPTLWTELGSMNSSLLGTFHLPRTQDSVVGEERNSEWAACLISCPHPLLAAGPPQVNLLLIIVGRIL